MIIIFDEHESQELLAVLHDIDPDDPRPYPMQLDDPHVQAAVVLFVIKKLYGDGKYRPLIINSPKGTARVEYQHDNLILSIGEFDEQHG